MRPLLRALIIGLMLVSLIAVMTAGCVQNNPTDKAELVLWEKTVEPYLDYPLWNNNQAADADEALMVPLLASFRLDESAWQVQFSNHFKRFMQYDRTSFMTSNRDTDLARIQYLYLASRFSALAATRGKMDLVPAGLFERLRQEVVIIWRDKPVQWHEDLVFTGGLYSLLNWKLSNPKVSHSYYTAIDDLDLFLFAVAADLRIVERNTKPESAWDGELSAILQMAHRVFKDRVVYSSRGGWLFQPGINRDHPEYMYAVYDQMPPAGPAIEVPDIAEDSSHSHRWPVWLDSFSGAANPGSEEARFYTDLRRGLEYQFLHSVLVPPDAKTAYYRLNNFMDGRNGLYRYHYVTTGELGGYGPFALSGALLYGWWGMLSGTEITGHFGVIAMQFPLGADALKTYIGPNTTRARNRLVAWPAYFTNGFAELVVRLENRMGAG